MKRLKAASSQSISPPPHAIVVRGTKSRTGCRTCKIRRVKCDEAKPHCFRCTSTGRKCDGYESQSPLAKLSAPGFVGLHPATSEPDMRAFEYFKVKALSGLMGFDYKSDFWTITIPQLSEASPAVHRAALALSARHEHIYNNHAALSAPESDLRTLKQYNRSIRQLCESETGQPVHVTLACCILFICLENLAGNHHVARAHLSNGLRLLKDWHAKDVESATERHVREQISLVFMRFDMQATALQGNREPELDPSFLGGNSSKYQQIPGSFPTIYAAQTALERLELRLLYVMSTYSFANPVSWTEEAIMQAKINSLQDLRMGFVKWRRTFDEFCLKHGATMKTRDLQLSVLLSMHHQTTTLLLDIKSSNSIEPGMTVAENHRFTTINNLAGSLINSAAKNGASFSADMGIIAPVFFVAMGAPDRNIRRDSIKLLKSIKDREGFWSATTTSMIAEGVLALEGASALATVQDVEIISQEEDPPLITYDEPASIARIR